MLSDEVGPVLVHPRRQPLIRAAAMMFPSMLRIRFLAAADAEKVPIQSRQTEQCSQHLLPIWRAWNKTIVDMT